MSQHYGMSDDGTMSTFVLASQVSQRLTSGKVNGVNRSALLKQLAGQLQHFHHIQLSWDEQWHTAKDAVTKAEEEIRRQDDEMEQIKAQTKDLAKAHEQRLAQACRELCGHIDAHKMEEHEHSNKLAKSQHRLSEQRALARHLEEQRNGLKSSLEKTHQKFDEVSTQFHKVRDDVGLGPPGSVQNANMELIGAQSRAESLATELEQDRSGLLDMKNHLGQLKADLASEASHAARLEDFVRRIAEGPSAAVRKGGGFVLDSAAKREAAGLLHEAGFTTPVYG